MNTNRHEWEAVDANLRELTRIRKDVFSFASMRVIRVKDFPMIRVHSCPFVVEMFAS
jgi:hypothetical protein